MLRTEKLKLLVSCQLNVNMSLCDIQRCLRNVTSHVQIIPKMNSGSKSALRYYIFRHKGGTRELVHKKNLLL